MCTQRAPYNWSEQLYQRHGETISNYLTEFVLPALTNRHSDELLKEVVKRWNNHKIMNKWMTKFFTYLDRYYVKYHALALLHEAGLTIYKAKIFDAIKVNLSSSILNCINSEREGITIDQDLLRSCVELYEAMGMGTLEAYTADLEASFLAQSKEFYARKADEWLTADSTPAYLIKIEEVLEREKSRVKAYLNIETDPKLMRVIEEEALEKRETELLEKEGSGCRVLLMNDNFDDLGRMFRLFKRLPDGLSPMAEILRQHILALGNDKIEARKAKIEAAASADGPKTSKDDESNDTQFVKDLLVIHDKYMDIVNDKFTGHALFQKALKDAFNEFVNRDVGKVKNAECISSFCDRLLKTGGEKVKNDQETEEMLEKAVQLFAYLQDKDLFAEIYRNQLAKRLLSNRSESDDMERTMIGKLKMRCGAQFTSKMEGMLNDLAVGLDHQNEFETYCRDQIADGIGSSTNNGLPTDFSVQVLTQGYWPSYRMLECKLPPVMENCIQVFSNYYENKASGRKLQWCHSLGSCEVKAVFAKKSYILQVTSLQAIVLNAFNGDGNAGPQSFESLSGVLGLTEDALKRTLHSLSCGKYKVLTRIQQSDEASSSSSAGGGEKKKESKGINSTDSFCINENFHCTLKKFRIPMASLEESHNPKRVEEDRSHVIEACIVRTMKARKTLAHQQLVGEVFSQLSLFRPDGKVIKKRIEALIEREYLERDPDQPNTYKYLA